MFIVVNLPSGHTAHIFTFWNELDLLWIVATRQTKSFQRTDDVFRIDKVYIRTKNNLESDMKRL